ncbi:hypothetical protein ACWC0A_37020, partial [Streptomyces scopuliridis]
MLGLPPVNGLGSGVRPVRRPGYGERRRAGSVRGQGACGAKAADDRVAAQDRRARELGDGRR